MTTAPTLVVFRRCKLSGQVLALFPTLRVGYNLCQAYRAGGPLTVVDYYQTLRDSTAASALLQRDVRALLGELVSSPYRYQVQVVSAEAIPRPVARPGGQLSFPLAQAA